MSKLDGIKPTGYYGLYKVEVCVEGEWVAMALVDKQSVEMLADLLCKLSDKDTANSVYEE